MIRIVGDCNFADGFFDMGFGTGTSIKTGSDPFHYIKGDAKDDFWIGNFECVCSDLSGREGMEARQFIISTEACNHVNHLDFYGVANNHVMQHGAEAYCQMVKYIENTGSIYAGTKEKRTAVFEHQGKKVTVTVFNQRPENFTKPPLYWDMPEYDDIKAELSKNEDCDYRIVYVHWGIEFINYPYNDQKQFAHFLIDSGADLVIGMHPHVMQGFEIYKGKHIFYSLGNCVFNMPWEPTKYSLQVNVDLASNEVSYKYLHIGEDFFPRYIENVPEHYSMEYLNSLLNISQDNEIYFAKAARCLYQYRKANRKVILKNAWRLKFSDIVSVATDFVKRKFK